MASLAKVFKFSIAELFVLLEAWFVFLWWDLQISFTQYKNWRSEIGNLADSTYIDDSAKVVNFPLPEQLKLIIQLSEIAGRFHIRKMNCLRRCLSQQKMLTKRGFKTSMHIGIRIENDKVKAHAWLTFQGSIINDSEDVLSRYSELKVANEHAILSALK